MDFKSFLIGALSTALVLSLVSATTPDATTSNSETSFEHVGAVSHLNNVYAVVAIDGGAEYRCIKVTKGLPQ